MTKIALSKIDLHLKNPRFRTTKQTSRDALVALCNQETIELARDIAKNGLNPSKKLIVVKHGSKFIVQEGNRRLTAMKLLANHALLDSITTIPKQIRNELKKASAEVLDSLRSIDCVVADTEEDAAKWVRLEHTGKNSGVGVSAWKREEQKRFDARFHKEPSITLQAIDLMRRLFEDDPEITNRLSTISLTPIERLVGDPNVRDFLGLSIDNKVLFCKIPETELKKALRKIILDLTNPDANERVTTRTLNKREDRQNYLDRFTPVDIPSQAQLLSPWKATAPAPEAGQRPAQPATREDGPAAKKASPVPSTESRKKLVSPSCVLQIRGNQRINDLYHDLRQLDIDHHVNAVSVLSRVFVEMCINHHLSSKLNKTETEIKDSKYSLRTKMADVVDDLTNSKKLSKDQLTAVNRELGNPNSGFHPNSLNAFIHNPNLTPSAIELKRGWNNIEPLIIAIWAN